MKSSSVRPERAQHSLKECQTPPELHRERQNLSLEFNVGYCPPRPAMLEYFSTESIGSVVKGEKEANIHPGDEIKLVRKVLDALAEIDPRIKGKHGEAVLERIGTRRVDDAEIQRLNKVYAKLNPGNGD